MAARYDKEKILTDWRTGEYTERALAAKHKVSPATVHNIVTGVEKTLAPIISKQIEAKQQLSELSEQELSTVVQIVDERTKHIQFFNDLTTRNLSMMARKLDDKTSVADHRMAQAAIKDGKETVLGKTPDTAIQINNATGQEGVTEIRRTIIDPRHSDAEGIRTTS
ncbi:MAG TPA: hypothetical protein VMV80_03835 [Anaerolineales bacterium]|nr:hypothetical protein [Anaerolineales bacterium]